MFCRARSPKTSSLTFAMIVGVTISLAGCTDASSFELQHSHVFHEDLASAEIPASWILEGHPRARVKFIAHAPDGEVNAAIWECTAGKFEWHFASDEFVHVLDGGVVVTTESGERRELKPGDVAYFPAGMRTVWEVAHFVRKLAVLRDNHAPLLARVQRKVGSWLSD